MTLNTDNWYVLTSLRGFDIPVMSLRQLYTDRIRTWAGASVTGTATDILFPHIREDLANELAGLYTMCRKNIAIRAAFLHWAGYIEFALRYFKGNQTLEDEAQKLSDLLLTLYDIFTFCKYSRFQRRAWRQFVKLLDEWMPNERTT